MKVKVTTATAESHTEQKSSPARATQTCPAPFSYGNTGVVTRLEHFLTVKYTQQQTVKSKEKCFVSLCQLTAVNTGPI